MYANVTAMAKAGGMLFVGISNGQGANLMGTDYLDGVAQFYAYSKGIPDNMPIRALAADPGGVLWCGIDAGVYRSADYGKTWSAAGLDTLKVTAFAVTGTGLFAGTQAQGLFRNSSGDSRIVSRASVGKDGHAIRFLDALGRSLEANRRSRSVFPLSARGAFLSAPEK
jgi:hypothetical protein